MRVAVATGIGAAVAALILAGCGGSRGIRTPTVVGLSGERAVMRLHAAGLVPAVKRVTSLRKPHLVFDQRPLGGTIVSPGSRTVILVSVGARAFPAMATG